MLLTRGLFGLGETIQTNFVRPDSAAPRPGGVSTGDTTPFFAINQHTWAQIDEEARNPPETLAAYATDRAIVAAGLPACSNESIDPSGGCWGTNAFLWDGPGTGTIKLPGTFDLWGVPIAVTDVRDGRFNKVFIPTAMQRRRIEVLMVRESQKEILGRHGVRLPGMRPLIGEVSGPIVGGNSGSLASAVKAKLIFATQAALDAWASAVSVQMVMDLVPDIALYWINFERNPIQPTSTEMTGSGGWKSWIERGGYPLSKKLLRGQKTFAANLAIGVTAGLACVCPSGTDIVAPVAGLTKNGIQFPTGKESSPSIIWDVYVSIYQDVNNPLFEISLYWDDKAWVTKIGEKAADFMKQLGNVLCFAAPVAQNQLTYAVSEKCMNTKTKQPCNKGSTDCQCVRPPSYVQAEVGAFNLVMSKFCSEWAADQVSVSHQPTPAPQTPPPTVTATTPWWLVVLGGLTVGAFIVTRRPTST